MAWNKDTYYYQNQMKALSGSDPEPGYKENDPAVLPSQELEDRIAANGLYKFVSLIKAKFDALKKAIRGSWRLHDEEKEAEDLNECIEVGNYKPKADSTASNGPVADGTKPFTLKVSQVGPDIEHGPLEALFTVDEETGLTGAAGLATDWLQSSMLLNFDDEDEGEFCIGCAGGIDTTVAIPYDTEYAPLGKAFCVKVSGLKGGHSGDDINKGLGCANKILARLLWNAAEQFGIRLSEIKGGNLRNAIAREAYAVVVVSSAKADALVSMVNDLGKKIAFEFRTTEPGLSIAIESVEMPQLVIDATTQSNLLNVLLAVAHGVLAMSRELPGLVETSTNLASIKMDGKEIHIATSQRSSVESAKMAAAQKIEATFRLVGAKVTHGDGYPGWTPNPDSHLLKVAVETYRRMFNHVPVVRAIHAGLECGLIGEKYPKMQMISYGPTLRGVHSPDERIEIKTVQMFWDLTLEILKSLK